MTKINHPRSGYNQLLWRSSAYDSADSLRVIFTKPRAHSCMGYRLEDKALRECTKCGLQKERGEFSKNQERKDSNQSKCSEWIEQKGKVIIVGPLVVCWHGSSNTVAMMDILKLIVLVLNVMLMDVRGLLRQSFALHACWYIAVHRYVKVRIILHIWMTVDMRLWCVKWLPHAQNRPMKWNIESQW